jgi:hypothetical protein
MEHDPRDAPAAGKQFIETALGGLDSGLLALLRSGSQRPERDEAIGTSSMKLSDKQLEQLRLSAENPGRPAGRSARSGPSVQAWAPSE